MGMIDRPNELLRVVRETLGLKVGERFTVGEEMDKYYFTEHDFFVEYEVLGKKEKTKSYLPLMFLCYKRIERVK